LLHHHNNVNLIVVSSRQWKGRQLSQIIPCRFELTVAELTPDELAAFDVDVWVLALPDGCSTAYVEKIPMHQRIIDCSADYRLEASWMYGLSDTTPSISNVRCVANPGCYATGMHLSLAPLRNFQSADFQMSVTVFGVSGFSGAGTKPSARNDEASLHDNFILPYALIGHKHERETLAHLPFRLQLSFIPHVGNFFRGMTLTIVVHQVVVDVEKLRLAFASFYKMSPLITIMERVPNIKDVIGTAKVVIGGFVSDHSQQSVRYVCVLDNLLKGAAAQVVQNLNLMHGLPVNKGLHAVASTTKVTVMSKTVPIHF